jgi:hypothetical protein
MTDSSLHGTKPAAQPIAFPVEPGEPVETGPIARILAAPETDEYVRSWLGVAAGRDPLLAYHEALTLAGMLELLTCEEAQAWLLPALKAALRQDTDAAFAATLDIAKALKPAAMVLREMGLRLPEPANNRWASGDPRSR